MIVLLRVSLPVPGEGTRSGRMHSTRRRWRAPLRVTGLSAHARVALAAGAAAAAVALRLRLDPSWASSLPFIFAYPAVALSGWAGGMWPGTLATALCALAAQYYWFEPRRSWAVTNAADVAALLTFAVAGAIISILNESWRRALSDSTEPRGRVDRDEGALAARQLAAIVESSDDAIVGKTLDGTITSWNRAAEQMFGYSATEAIGRSIRTIFPTARWSVEDDVVRRLRRGERVRHFETARVRKDGTEVPVSLTISPILDAAGVVIGASTIARDISERKRAEEEQRRSRDQLRLAVEAAPAAMIMVDRHGAIVMVNALTERLLGYRRDELLGESIERLVPSRFRERHVADRGAFFVDLRQRPMGAGRELFAVRRDGSEVPVEIGLSPIHFEGHVFVLAAVTDISERKALDRQRAALLEREQAARADLERASRLKDEFLAVLSHELRTPLNAVLGYAALLNSGALAPERALHALRAIQRNAEAQARLVESLLDLSRIMAGKLQLAVERVPLVPIVEAAIDVVRPDAQSKGLTVTMMRPASEITVAGEPGRLQQVFWNLLSNAVKFTPDGGRVDVGLETRGAHAHIEVRDTGRGIRPDFLPHVFERFSQAGGELGQHPTGLGLGLALVREMVHAHGGTVTAFSEGDGRGSTFTVLLPLSSPAAEPHVDRNDDPASPSSMGQARG